MVVKTCNLHQICDVFFFLIIIMQSIIIQFRMKRLRVSEYSYRIHLLILIGPHVKTWTNELNPPQIVLPTKSLTKAIISLLKAIKSILRKIKNFSFQNVTQQKQQPRQPKHVVSLMTIYLCVLQMSSFYLRWAIKRIFGFSASILTWNTPTHHFTFSRQKKINRQIA